MTKKDDKPTIPPPPPPTAPSILKEEVEKPIPIKK